MHYKDNFSIQASDYAKYRPSYPPELIEFVAHLAPNRGVAWDCATGNGQTAVELTQYFAQVIATDASTKQIEQAFAHPKVQYAVASAENSGLPDTSIDLVTVAQAAHWFQFDNFYQEIRRVVKPRAILAIWGYGLMQISPAIDQVIHRLYYQILGDTYWDKERKHLDNHYQTLPFPFALLPAPEFKIQRHWNLAELIGYLHTWSSVQNYIKKNTANPLDLIRDELTEVWKNPDNQHLTTWDIYLKVGEVK
ncbi:MAG: class I SAM-dependent methyltransferase [Microscillaceae bacterium]|jgi:SAM-dependent methyltransferase|nr:class I SAM-dependent methyltransferase [Microscillaceae bacterium]